MKKQRKATMKTAKKAATKKAARAVAKKANIKKTKNTKPAVSESEAEPKTRLTKSKREAVANVYTQEEVKTAVDQLSANENVTNYLKKNVSKRALDVIEKLIAPKTDEALAEELGMKINAVRRILNILQGYGVTNYYIAKNVNGWLSFAWYINVSKLPPFFEYIESIENKRPTINNECNDYFICSRCYDATKLIFTFDAAFEENFKCGSCGKNLAMMDKEQATKLIASSRQV